MWPFGQSTLYVRVVLCLGLLSILSSPRGNAEFLVVAANGLLARAVVSCLEVGGGQWSNVGVLLAHLLAARSTVWVAMNT